jgi:serine/threonine protein kinase
MCHYNRKYK